MRLLKLLSVSKWQLHLILGLVPVGTVFQVRVLNLELAIQQACNREANIGYKGCR